MNQVLVELIPPCSNGNDFFIESGSVCGSNPVVSVTGTLTPSTNAIEMSSINFEESVTCSSTTYYGDFAYCSFTITNVPEYVPFNIEYSLTYQDNTNSKTYNYPYFTVSTPQLVVQSVLDMYSVPKGLRVTNKNATQVSLTKKMKKINYLM